MKLSEAMRLGAALKPQSFNPYFPDEEAEDGTICTCALGAALDAVGKLSSYDEWGNPGDLFPHIKTTLPLFLRGIDALGRDIETIEDAIMELNDVKHLSREEIADLIVANGWDCDYVRPATEEVKKEEPCQLSRTL